ncbi:hypothetical protein ClosIBUN13A_CONTIG231g03671 [Clostridium sp. IBUN13A]|mgnify:CR=1|nr:hypothetical protein ClosIBUN125C_CONTIG14g00902 [Clostridium sp. IBUN125C]KJZ91691.1 hypothetical protein ClosIBUN13A_CONTIG231g03671 [Clostridium sp. IBUN13A]KJZ92346.1 hypothetical protein ClosIBUN22A_CONTIG172g03563 [Clostridium sp. IBUN22A]KJZ93731.1 hypothetical protein ClosIBUN62F_CONTIG35g01348 [Clostridium sp. IBUN62F]
MIAAVVINVAVLNHAVNVNLAAVNNLVAVVVDMAMVMVMDLDLVDVLGSGLFLFYSSAVVELDLAEDLVEDAVIQDSSKI